MKKLALLLALCMVSSLLGGCTFEIPSISEAKNIIDAYAYYNSTGELPENIRQILSESTGDDESSEAFQKLLESTPEETLKETLKAASKTEILDLAKKYYEASYPAIESDTKSEYNRLVTWKPDFSGKKASEAQIKLQKFSSVNVTLALSYTDAKNFYLAMAASVFSIDPEDPNSAGNLGAAIAAYADDMLLEGASQSSAAQYYTDAEKVYQYALLQSGKDGQYPRDALPHLVSLGNLYLDAKKYEEAYACFQSALEIDSGYWPGVEGLYNTYMALRQYQKALDLIADSQKFPGIIGDTVKVGEKKEEDLKKPQVSASTAAEEALEQKMDSMDTIESISTADFLDAFDAEAKDKLNTLIRQVQDKMNYKAPPITMISQYATLKAVSEPAGQSALEAFYEGLSQYSDELFELQERLFSEEPSEEAYQQLSDYAEEYMKTRSRESLHKFYQAFSELYPEFSIFTANPYDYANPIDLIVQRHNIENFNMKYLTYSGYMGVVNGRVNQTVSDIVESCRTRTDALWDEMNTKLGNLPDDATAQQVHAIHANYYPRINNIRETSWNQATQVTVTAYQQKIKKYAEQMYNDCMKHVILISDPVIQQKLEDKLKYGVLSGLVPLYEQLYESFSFTSYDNDCGCDIGALRAEAEARQKEADMLANEQIKRNMEAKKKFETGEIDENSEYYKKIIKPYEVKMSSPFVEGVVGPYKSSFKIKIDLPGTPLPTLEFGKVENHIRNTTSFNGGVEIGEDADLGNVNVGVKAYLKFTATRGSDGQFNANDVDIIGGGKATLETAFTSSEVGMEASAVRGTKSMASFSVTGDSLLNDEFKAGMGDWAPNLTKELWSGEYPH